MNSPRLTSATSLKGRERVREWVESVRQQANRPGVG